MSCRPSTSLASLASLRGARTLRSTASVRQFSSTGSNSIDQPYYNPWKYRRAHVKKDAEFPNPIPRLYEQQVVMVDGSTFRQYSTAPTPEVIRLTRDVSNNQIWWPGSDRKMGDGGGAVEAFLSRYSGMNFMEAVNEHGHVSKKRMIYADLSWMEEGGRIEKAPPSKKKAAKGKKK